MRGAPAAERPRPRIVKAGTRPPRPGEDQPTIGSLPPLPKPPPPSQPGRVPAGNRVGLPSVQAPPQLAWQFQPCRPRCGGGGPAQNCTAIVQLRLNVGAEVEGEADLVTAAVDPVDDVDTARRPVQ